ncbi:carboxylesterase/lipase family protein [Marinobacter sp.]|uniref:carboxylesterase/lipase family protein n=1 Tax=Marinobacter sp. TaxID=50741 RepID=UPI003564BF7B
MNFLQHHHFWRMSMISVLAASLLAGCGGSSSSADEDDTAELPPNVRQTQAGQVEGTEQGNLLAFRGIPYAKPPVGELRLAPPQPAGAWDDVLDASAFGNSCPQSGSAFNGFTDSLEEDCLFLNVYTPAEGENHPVMVWIHGGAFITGSGGESYEPSRLVEEGVVVVTLNYRLGVLGFLPAAGLPEGNGQFGLLDQQLALKWVQDNIGVFGGDADNVTIFGESAGGHSVLSQLVSAGAGTGSEGLFHKAIVQSGAYQPTQIPQEVGEAVIGAPVVAALGCSDAADIAACLRDEEVTTAEILEAQGDMWFNPTWGQGILPYSIQAALDGSDGAAFPQGIPVMTGNNLNEGRLFLALDEISAVLAGSPDPVDTPEEYEAEVRALLSSDPRNLDADQVAADYLVADGSGPLSTPAFTDPGDPDRFSLALASIQTSWRFACNQIAQVNSLADQDVPTFGYWFTDQNAPSLFGPDLTPALSFDLGAAHALEIQYVLNSEATIRARGATDEQVALSERMIDHWVQFARYGDPSPDDGTGAWSDYATGTQLMELTPETPASEALVDVAVAAEAHNCAYWADPPRAADET